MSTERFTAAVTRNPEADAQISRGRKAAHVTTRVLVSPLQLGLDIARDIATNGMALDRRAGYMSSTDHMVTIGSVLMFPIPVALGTLSAVAQFPGRERNRYRIWKYNQTTGSQNPITFDERGEILFEDK